MAQSIIQIKRSTGTAIPSLHPGELAYSSASSSNGLGVLYIGSLETTESGLSTTAYVVGGKKYTALFNTEENDSIVKGKVTAGKAIVVDETGKIDHLDVTDTVSVTKLISSNESKIITIGDTNASGQKVIIKDPYVTTVDGDVTLEKYVTDLVQSGVITLTAGDGIAPIINSNGTYNIALDPTGVVAKSYGSSTRIPVLDINQYGQITNASEATVSTTLSVENDSGDKLGSVDLINGKLKFADGIQFTDQTGSVNVSIDNTVVRTIGEQTISGKKVFTEAPFINSDEVATKSFVNTEAVLKNGDTLTGVIKYAENINEDVFDENTLITKKYADNVALGFVYHVACETGSSENVAGIYTSSSISSEYPGIGATFTLTDNSGNATTINGVVLTQGMRVLLVGQTDATQNGAYEVTTVPSTSTGNVILTRAEDFDGHPTIEYKGASFLVTDGGLKGSVWRLTNEGKLEFGTTELEFVHIFTPNSYTGGDGININDLTVSLAQGNTIKVINGKAEVASGNSNEGKALFAGSNSTAASWKEITISDIKSGVLASENGGTGVANSTNLTWTGGSLGFALTGDTAVTLPVTGTLSTLSGTETLTNKTIEAITINVSDGTDASNISTGAVRIAGGVSVVKNMHVGQNIIGSNTSKLEGFIIDGGNY